MGKHMRPRPSSIELLPEECEGAIAWAAQELAKRGPTLSEVYREFKQRLIALQGELGLSFDIPHFSSFSRHSLRLGNLRSRINRSTALARELVEKTDGHTEDTLTRGATVTLKSLIFEMLEYGGEDGFSPKETLAMSGALKQLQQAENLSTARRQKLDSEFADKAGKIIDAVAKEKGMSADTIAQLRKDFLGVRPKATKGES